MKTTVFLTGATGTMGWAGMQEILKYPEQYHLRIDGRIDEHWSLYAENFFSGKRLALTTLGTKTLKPTVVLNLGCQYEQDNWTTFLQLNNYIHRHNDIYYGYQSEGINFLLGGSYKF